VVNGRKYPIRVEPRRTLVDAIRDDCGQTGTHIGCEHGVCGSCTVIVDGQIHGGVAQGIANALLEEIVYDETGNILTTSLADYLPPTSHEIPPIEIHHLETLTEASITKAKGLGEGGTIGAPAAVVNAINDALSPFGVSIDEFPATPQRIRTALRAAAEIST
jgi:carbon-monoxide dehydrogenase large subunit